MANKKNQKISKTKNIQTGKDTSRKGTKPIEAGRSKTLKQDSPGKRLLWMLPVLAITALCFSGVVKNDFVNWDDSYHIFENPNLIHPDSESLKNIFSVDKGSVIGTFIPLTVFSYYIEKMVTGDFSTWLIHFDNLVLHLVTVFLVMRLLWLLGFNNVGMFIGGLLFGIHPMRVESVAWATERKDVLYAMFFFAALVCYVRWVKQDDRTKKTLWYLVMLVLAVLSGLSKIQAVALPLSMLAIDYWFKRPLNFKLIWEKTPFWILSLTIGLINIYTLKLQGAINENVVNYTAIDRICIGTYSFCVYLYKLILPYPMAPLYSYPRHLPLIVYLSPALFIAACVGFYLLWKQNKRVLVFGVLFFFFNIVFLLQVVGAGQGFLADRFTYVAYFGWFAVAGWYVGKAAEEKNRHSNLMKTLAGAFLVFFGVMTVQQVKIWKDGGTMWTHVLKFEKDLNDLPWVKRAQYYRDEKRYDLALPDFSKAISLRPENGETYNSRGKCYFDMVMNGSAGKQSRDFALNAIDDFTSSINLTKTQDNKALAEKYINRGAAQAYVGKDSVALNDFNRGIELDSTNKNGYRNRSVVYFNQGKMEETIQDYTAFIQLDKNDPNIWYSRGMIKRSLGSFNEALPDLNRALELNPSIGLAYLERARVHAHLGDKTSAAADYKKAASFGLQQQEYDVELMKSAGTK